ncbi:MAG: hypothetical protein ACEQSX_10150, partial [Baekduiaceae bacterium]
MSPAALTITEATVDFGAGPVLDQVSLDVAAGEFVCGHEICPRLVVGAIKTGFWKICWHFSSKISYLINPNLPKIFDSI